MRLPNDSTRVLTLVICAALFFQFGCSKNYVSKTQRLTITETIWGNKSEVLAEINGNANEPLVNTGKIYIKDNLIFVNEINKGIHVFDNSDKTNPKPLAFLKIPGNKDIAVNGDILYADMYADLLAIDISDIRSVRLTKLLPKLFTDYNYFSSKGEDSTKIAIGFITKDTTVDINFYYYNNCAFCSTDGNQGAVPLSSKGNVRSPGVAGSMAGMVLMNNYLYAISNSNTIAVVGVGDATQPSILSTMISGFQLQTIYPFENKLFIGTTTGMFMYDVSDPENLLPLGQFGHVRACDPVISDGNYAYVTLHSESWCGGMVNELDVVSLTDLKYPVLLKTLPLNQPKGLSKDGNVLFVCDGKNGVGVYDATKPETLKQTGSIDVHDAYDAIAQNNTLLIVAVGGIYQYDYTNLNDIKRLSRIATTK